MQKLKTTLSDFLIACLLLFPGLAFAHDARPAVVALNEQLPGVFQFVVSVPPTVEPSNLPVVHWPDGCTEQNVTTGTDSSSGSVLCEQGLKGKSLSLDYPFFNPSLATFYRITALDGTTMTAMQAPTRPQWDIPEDPSRRNIAAEYLTLGVAHIIGGTDHLLFVLGLLVIARTLKRILWTITGFTIAHSITLSLSALGFVNIPVVPVEAGIALSILFLAHEISREQTARYPLGDDFRATDKPVGKEGSCRHSDTMASGHDDEDRLVSGSPWAWLSGFSNSVAKFCSSVATAATRRLVENPDKKAENDSEGVWGFHDSLTYRFPLIVSFSFGLLHGLGFASALGEIGLVKNEILISLLFFNVGVEAGQIAFILSVILVTGVLVRICSQRIDFSDSMVLRRVDTLAAYAIGIPSSYWVIDRVAQFLL